MAQPVARALLAWALAGGLVATTWASISRATTPAAPIPNTWACSTGDTSPGCVSSSLAPMPTSRARLAVATGQDGRIYAMGGCNGTNCGTPVGAVEVYDPNANSWACSMGDTLQGCTTSSISPLPTARDGLVAAVGPDGRIYTIGGYDGNTWTIAVEAYDPTTNTWACSLGDASPGCSTQSLAPMPTGRARLAMVVGTDGRFYALGGCNLGGSAMPCGTTLATVEVYDPVAHAWTCSTDDTAPTGCTATSLAPMPTPRSLLGGALGPDGRIYAIGGWNGVSLYGTVEVYDPVANAWTTANTLNTPRYGLATVTGLDGRVYAIGGCGGIATCGALSSVEAYSTRTGSWAASASLPTARGRLAATVGLDRHLYAIGGYAGNSHLSTVEAYVVPFFAYLPYTPDGSAS